jgi:2-deoxy-D-gluconate 3-dehydrogenase
VKLKMSFGKIDLSGRNAVIADCGPGMGYEMAMGLAAVGANLILLGRSANNSEAPALAGARAKGVKAAVIACDPSQRLSVENMVAQAARGFGGIDILLNNAVMDKRSPPLAGPGGPASALKSFYLLGRAVAQQMIKQGKGGKIVNVAATTALNPEANGKGGISRMSKVWALELREYGINVNALEPCRAPAPVWAREEAGAAARLEQIAGPVVFLSSDWASQITGATLYVGMDPMRWFL